MLSSLKQSPCSASFSSYTLQIFMSISCKQEFHSSSCLFGYCGCKSVSQFSISCWNFHSLTYFLKQPFKYWEIKWKCIFSCLMSNLFFVFFFFSKSTFYLSVC